MLHVLSTDGKIKNIWDTFRKSGVTQEELIKFSRQQRKEHERLICWYNTLDRKKLDFINTKVADEVRKEFGEIMSATDIATIASLVDNTELSLNEMYHITQEANKNLKELGDFIYKWGGDYMKKLDKLEVPAKERIGQLLEQGKNQAEIVKTIAKEFPDLKSAHIKLAFKQCKTIFDETKKLKIIEKYIFGDADKREKVEVKEFPIVEEVKEEVKAEVVEKPKKKAGRPKKVKEKAQEEVQEETIIEKGDVKMGKLLVVSEVKNVKGEFGTYKIEKNGDKVIISNSVSEFKGLEEIEDKEKETKELYERALKEFEELKAVAKL